MGEHRIEQKNDLQMAKMRAIHNESLMALKAEIERLKMAQDDTSRSNSVMLADDALWNEDQKTIEDEEDESTFDDDMEMLTEEEECENAEFVLASTDQQKAEENDLMQPMLTTEETEAKKGK